MTAELAVAIPAVIVVLGMCLVALQVAGTQVRLQDAASLAARALARGDPVPAVPGLEGATLSTSSSGSLVCVDATSAAVGPAGSLLGVTLHARGCALGEGEP